MALPNAIIAADGRRCDPEPAAAEERSFGEPEHTIHAE